MHMEALVTWECHDVGYLLERHVKWGHPGGDIGYGVISEET